MIAILAAILFPVFARAREKARQTSCLSNQKQIGLAVLMYAQDYDERFPPQYIRIDNDSEKRVSGFYDCVGPYTKNEQMYVCPSGHKPYTYGRKNLPSGVGFYKRTMQVSYGMVQTFSWSANYDRFGGLTVWVVPGDGPNGAGRPLSDLIRPSDVIVAVESTSAWNGAYGHVGFDADGNPRTMDESGECGSMQYRHNKMMNVIYGDGHAKARGQFMDMTIFSDGLKQ
jgi:prepilin-type processing-associated H-X9-DG protein